MGFAKTAAVCAIALCATAALSGCATIVRGTQTDFTVQSEPPGASVRLSSGEACPETPCTIRRPRNETFSVIVTKEGFAPVHRDITQYLSDEGVVAGVGNVFAGGVVGVSVDAATGANLDLRPNPFIVTLRPLAEGEAQPPDPAFSTAAPVARQKAELTGHENPDG